MGERFSVAVFGRECVDGVGESDILDLVETQVGDE